MAFFKPSSPGSSLPGKSFARLHAVIWVLIYTGLLTLVFGLALARLDNELGWAVALGGALVALVGAALIYIRSKMKADS